MELMTQAEYARHRDVSREAVRKAIAAARITTVEKDGKKLIDPEVADIQWARNTDQKQFERANAGKINRLAADVDATPPAEPKNGQAKAPSGGGGGSDSGSVYWDARSRREMAEAERAEIELEKLRGSVVDKAGARNAAMSTWRTVRDTLLGIAPKLAPKYAGMTDAFQIERDLEAALRAVMEDAARLSAEDLDRTVQ